MILGALLTFAINHVIDQVIVLPTSQRVPDDHRLTIVLLTGALFGWSPEHS